MNKIWLNVFCGTYFALMIDKNEKNEKLSRHEINRGTMNLFSKLKEMKMMLIDDDVWIRNSFDLYFDGEGVDLLSLETAEEGLEALKKTSYDIIIVDYRLPGIDGLEFFKRIKATHPEAIKILITAFKDQKVLSEAANIGIQDLIEKPFTIKTIEQALSWMICKHDLQEKKNSKDFNTGHIKEH